MDEVVQISSKALELFMRFGIRSVSMDDLSSELGMSKKTLYKHFSTKDDLIWSVMELEEKTNLEKCLEIFKPENNAIDELLGIGKYLAEHLTNLNPSLIYDLNKYYPKVWDHFMQRHKSGTFFEVVYQNLEKGKKQGLFRKDLDSKMITGFYLTRMNALFDQKMFPANDYDLPIVYFESLKYHIYGVSTPKGAQYFQKNIKKLKKEHHAA